MSHVTFNPGDNWPINHVFLSALLFVNELWEKYIMRIYIKPWQNILEMRNSQYQKWIKKNLYLLAMWDLSSSTWDLWCMVWDLLLRCMDSVLWLQSTGSVAPRYMGSQFPKQGSSPCSLHDKVYSQPEDHQGSPQKWFKQLMNVMDTLESFVLAYSVNLWTECWNESICDDRFEDIAAHCDDTVFIVVFLFVYLRNQIITYFSFITRTLKNWKLSSP